AIVLHHLYDHSRGSHEWALAEARRQLRIARALAALDRRIERWGWLMPAREAAAAALKQLAEAIGVASRARCAAAYRAYRLSAAPALQGEAQRRLSPEMLGALQRCHDARRSGGAIGADDVRDLWECSEQLAIDHDELNAAWAAIELTGLGRPARRLLGEHALERACARDRKRGWGKIERELRNDPLLPRSFRANPAQHFYALQLALADRRRQQWREACDREPDAFELAA
ncbi:MAG TPA: hypothetical protein VGD23_08805, partial [Sphingomicrobium sp.]